MKSKTRNLIVFAIITMLIFLARSAQPSQSANTDAARAWEHLAMTIDATDGPGDTEASGKIVKLGSEDWELVSVQALTKDGTTTKLIYFFKRPK